MSSDPAAVLQAALDETNLAKLMALANPALHEFVADAIELCRPAKVFVATDDASVAEFAGARVCVVPGDPDNIKITHPLDLTLAEAIRARWIEERIA